jgi:electron transfer flavoprotein beta subunit
MKILVCLKQVPHKDARLDVRSDAKWIQEENIKFEINVYDTYALEEALRIRDRGEGEVVVACIGPDRVQQSLRTALGMGADRAIHIWDEALASTDSVGIATTLAAAAASENFDLVLMGLMADDSNFGITGPFLAERLGMPHVTSVVKAEFNNGELQVERELEGGTLEVLSIPRPCLLAVQTGINEVRYASLKGIMQAKKKPLDKKTLGDLGLSAEDFFNDTATTEIYTPPKGEGADILQGSPDEVAQQIVTKVKELGLL